MIEAMACGTPVIAFRSGSVPEVVDHGVTGFIVDDEDEAVDALKRLGELDRRKVRARFEQRFSAARMAQDYVDHYKRVAAANASDTAIPIKLGLALPKERNPTSSHWAEDAEV
jgi:glycosyltransferase involved in cell wall biosynthesis